MKVIKTEIEGLLVIEPQVYGDDRGFFIESWNENKFNDAIGITVKFVQDNHSKSEKGILRGMHFQSKHVQSKLVRVISGSVYDVVVDLRPNSKTYGNWFGIILSSVNKKQLWIPKGFAHGFVSLEDGTEFLYKCDDTYHPEHEHSLKWDDKDININWSEVVDDVSNLRLSNKDSNGMSFNEAKKLKLEC